MTLPLSAKPRFLYVGGDPALDLINTVDWTSRGPEHERLESFEQLTRWAEGAGVIDAALPPPASEPTPFARLGNWLPMLLAAILLITAIVIDSRRRYRRDI